MAADQGHSDETERRARLAQVWEKETTPDRGRITSYLEHRGLPTDVLDSVPHTVLRFAPCLAYYDGEGRHRGDFPAMVAKVTDVGGSGVTLHRTYLSPEGPGKLDLGDGLPAKKLMTAVSDGATMGAAIKLSGVASVLGIAEGVETALAVSAATGQHVWSTVSAGGMKTVIIPDEVRTVHIWADNDRSGCGLEAAEELAARLFAEGRSGFVHLPARIGTDWLDEYVDRGPEALQNELAEGVPWAPADTASSPSTCDDWEPPLPLDSGGRLPQLPVEVLPQCLRDMATEIAVSRQVPVDMPGVTLLGIAAVAAAGRFMVQLPTHAEPLNLFMLAAVDPGTRKSQVVRDVTAPVFEMERELCDRAKPAIDEARARHELDQERLRHLRGKGAKLDDPAERRAVEAEMAELLNSTTAPPSPPRLLADDVTPERLAALLAENQGVMAIVSAEGGVVGMMAGRYSDKGGPNLDVYLKAHSGDPLRVDRASDGGRPHMIDRPTLTMILMVQPEVLSQLAKVPSARGRGLPARFLYSLPACELGTRTYRNRPIAPAIERRYRDRLHQMLRDVIPEAPRPLSFSGAALEVWTDFHNTVERRLAEGADLRPISDWASKAPGAVARIAGVLHVVEQVGARPEDVPIAPATVEAAIALGHYFIEHAVAAFALMSDSPDMKLARRIAAWIERHKVTEFSLRECHQHTRTERPSDLEPGLRILEERDIIRQLPAPARSGPGRKPSPRYSVNPHLKDPSQNSHNAPGTPGQRHSVNSVNHLGQPELEVEVSDPPRMECLL